MCTHLPIQPLCRHLSRSSWHSSLETRNTTYTVRRALYINHYSLNPIHVTYTTLFTWHIQLYSRDIYNPIHVTYTTLFTWHIQPVPRDIYNPIHVTPRDGRTSLFIFIATLSWVGTLSLLYQSNFTDELHVLGFNS